MSPGCFVAGSPIKHEKRRIVQEAILLALSSSGQTPEEALAPAMKAQFDKAIGGDTAAAVFLRDSLDGKPAQQIQLGGDGSGEPIAHRIEQVIVDAVDK